MRKESLRCGRFKELAISADVPVTSTKSEVPALWRVFAQRWLGLCQKHETVRKQILHPHTGNFEPGAMTLVLGEPQSGKSSLMKILSDRFPLTKSAFTWMAESRTTARTRQPQLIPAAGYKWLYNVIPTPLHHGDPPYVDAFKCSTDLGYHDLTNI
ncbi:hypothetical protein DYB28_000365 [Aphanomyces astaci]|uniref:Uncharacterized protein n=1 Tax=Aphanomyces astaci TaxID=112090 RepID=A0A397E1N9_APHAT|nr:hypothetical protein DYB36_010531 [Aphanomyces astaci]RHY16503.1 hypothetical protein DYB25_007304 [Aphanomyces astaci]RHY44041.1 hypothetical protein DYB38_009292 [Aphanomyces astaci]RHY62582.1 hypothetical protein DYB34_008477 [Aphanomyces astaci]RHY72154.1 hypothetical protein DYB30_008458 [Aphanomyces astaci]